MESKQLLEASLVSYKVLDSRRKKGAAGIWSKSLFENAYNSVNKDFWTFAMMQDVFGRKKEEMVSVLCINGEILSVDKRDSNLFLC